MWQIFLVRAHTIKLSVCSIAPCIYHRDHMRPVDLCKTSSVSHQWRQCETKHWAFSFSAATSHCSWVMSYVSKRLLLLVVCQEMTFLATSVCALIQKTEDRNHLKAVQLEALDKISMSVCSCHILQIYSAWWYRSCLQTLRRENVSWPCFSTP